MTFHSYADTKKGIDGYRKGVINSISVAVDLSFKNN